MVSLSVQHPLKTPNFTKVVLGALTVWFSYETPIAFQHLRHGLKVRENNWGPTTGKHINHVDGGNQALRLSGQTFEALLSEVLP